VLHCVNVTDLGSGSAASYTLHIAISFAVAIYERPKSLKICTR